MAAPNFQWDNAAGRFRGPRGKFVAGEKIRGALDGYLDQKQKRAIELAEQLQRREISIADWQRQFGDELTKMHLNAAALARGGAAQMDDEALEKAGAFIRSELQYLQRMAIQTELGKPLDGRFLQRVKQFAQAPRAHFHEAEREEKETRGFNEERSIRHARDSCAGCLFWSSAGWRLLGTVALPGTRDCRRNCRCMMEYRKNSAGFLEGNSEEQKGAVSLTDYTPLLQEIEADAKRMKNAGFALDEIIRVQEDKIRRADRELLLAFDPDGTLQFTVQGDAEAINLSGEQMRRLKGTIVTHNHPSARSFKNSNLRAKGASFSNGDIVIAIRHKVAELRAVTPFQTFSIQCPSPNSPKEFTDLLNTINTNLNAEGAKLILKGQSPENADWLARHEVWKRMANRHGFTYKAGDEQWPKHS